MKKIGLICINILLLLACEKEEKKYDPILIQSQVQSVSVYGASDGSISLTVSGGKEPYSFNWSNGLTSKDITDLALGKYTVIVTDANGDTASHSDSITEPKELKATFTKANTKKLGNADGHIELTISGGITPYTINWNNGATTPSISGLEAGTYTVDITDAHQATFHLEIPIYDPVTLTLTPSDASTYNGTDGSINMNIQGGKSPYTILWSNGQTTQNLNALAAGYYSVSVTDDEQSIGKSAIQVYEPYDKTGSIADMVNTITRLTQSGIRIEYNSQVIYIDPINTGGFSADADLILITHNHSDHISPSVITALKNSNTKVIAPDECQSTLESIISAGNLTVSSPGDKDTLVNVPIEVVYAYNSYHISPHSVGYIITLNGIRIYHAGDTRRITEMTGYNADIAFLPLGQTYTFATVAEAENAAKDVNAKVVIPIHYGVAEGKPQDAWKFKTDLAADMDVVVMPSNNQ
jgi:L-ascorbate metabolism protein UlaG (beta-lactamase superfamily)